MAVGMRPCFAWRTLWTPRSIATYFVTQGRDEAEKIKYLIKSAIENWGTENVMLLGNNIIFPARETHITVSDDDTEIFVSDLYFADIYNEDGTFSSWDSNDNDNFAEFRWIQKTTTDKMDLMPDVAIGRIPCNNNNELTIIINKIITYENERAYTQDWFSSLLGIGGDSFIDARSDPLGIPEGEFVNDYVINIMDGFIAERLWASNGILGSTSPSGASAIKDAIIIRNEWGPGGPSGFGDIPHFGLPGYSIDSTTGYFYLIWGLVAVVMFFSMNLIHSDRKGFESYP